MAGILTRPSSGLGQWRTAPLETFKSVWRRQEGAATEEGTVHELVDKLDAAADMGARLAERMLVPGDNQPIANAASICRWELLTLRERVVALEVHPRLRGTHSQVVRHLDGAAAAARTLSSGYRFHNLERICSGGEALDRHLTALDRLRAGLASEN